jgi:hypothetical protein
MTPSTTPVARLAPLAAFTAGYLLVAVAASVRFGNKEFLFYIITMLLLIAAVMFIHRRMPLRGAQLWALSLWGLAHMAGGLWPLSENASIDDGQRVLYSLWLIPGLLKYDQLVHAYGFAITTWICWHGLRHHLLERSHEPITPSLGLLTLAAASGMGFGALNEVIEFIAVLTIPNTNVGGYENTGWDLVFNLLGCLIAAIMIRCRWWT